MLCFTQDSSSPRRKGQVPEAGSRGLGKGQGTRPTASRLTCPVLQPALPLHLGGGPGGSQAPPTPPSPAQSPSWGVGCVTLEGVGGQCPLPCQCPTWVLLEGLARTPAPWVSTWQRRAFVVSEVSSPALSDPLSAEGLPPTCVRVGCPPALGCGRGVGRSSEPQFPLQGTRLRPCPAMPSAAWELGEGFPAVPSRSGAPLPHCSAGLR